jgi:hypothetical protein
VSREPEWPVPPPDTKPARPGYGLVPCWGEAHHNVHIDYCLICAPRWGWAEVAIVCDVCSRPVGGDGRCPDEKCPGRRGLP